MLLPILFLLTPPSVVAHDAQTDVVRQCPPDGMALPNGGQLSLLCRRCPLPITVAPTAGRGRTAIAVSGERDLRFPPFLRWKVIVLSDTASRMASPFVLRAKLSDIGVC